MQRVSGYLKSVLDEVMPRGVAVALDQAEDWSADAAERYCPRCGASAGPGAVTARGCPFCLDQTIHWHRLTRLSAYADPLDGWIKAMKFGKQWSWARWFGEQLAQQLGKPLDENKLVVCPVPMPWMRRWSRGFNQSRLMAEALADVRGYPCLEALKRTRHTAPQTTVAASQRPANVRGSLAMRPIDLTGYDVILVDDIKTTGSTLNACARLLKQAGARSVHAAVAAVADPKGQHFKSL
ncbi:ComF family protein [Algisphaera agarilytica]|uniref:ComF family protein n=1 Tax=Algisphaera agarilytica TaxID=1385975 RepID=A0A7X0H366_9BACT|nr:ComF family protein [Algisphaera agarilytica]MBB6428360.1 ComF family protein [Algisphaera agarilytica]